MKTESKNTFSPAFALAVIYFFLNSLFLPEGLLFTSLLAPFFLFEMLRTKNLKPLLVFVLILFPFIVLQVFQGVDGVFYARSLLLCFANFIFCVVVQNYFSKTTQAEQLFKQILWTNFLLLPIALIALKIPVLKEYFWYYVPISPGVPIVPRLKLFTYEASYYSTLFAPIAIFYFLKVFLFQPENSLLILCMVCLPLVLSFSLGVIGGLLISLVLVFAFHPLLIFTNPKLKWGLFSSIILLLISFLFLWFLFPHNPLIERLKNILEGKDTSARGRTYEAFDLAWRIAKIKSSWFGIGLGQLKILGRNIIVQYYYYTAIPTVVRIPNACAETLAVFGIVGFAIRMLLQIGLFFYTKVYTNYFQLAIFLFIFIYQFTGSYLMSTAEFVLWILAFTNCFPEFNKEKFKFQNL